jgi:hypothetical protein
MLLGLKTERERALDEAFEKAKQKHRNGTEALEEARRKIEAARANVHARADALKEETGGFGEQQQ